MPIVMPAAMVFMGGNYAMPGHYHVMVTRRDRPPPIDWIGKVITNHDYTSGIRSYDMSTKKIRDLCTLALKEPSQTPMANHHQIFCFLAICTCKSDLELFGEQEHWQLPSEFEKLRQGDCEDHAIWTWRKLVDLKEDARLVIGSQDDGGHVWVNSIREDGVWLLETTAKTDLRFQRIDETKGYKPKFSVDGRLRFFRHEKP
jgi:hypothetical protein